MPHLKELQEAFKQDPHTSGGNLDSKIQGLKATTVDPILARFMSPREEMGEPAFLKARSEAAAARNPFTEVFCAIQTLTRREVL